MDKMNLFQRMAAITAELGTVAKNLNVSPERARRIRRCLNATSLTR